MVQAQVKIGRQTWQIKVVSDDEIKDAFYGAKKKREPIDGLCIYDQRLILINANLSSDKKVAALRHELVHAFCPEMSEQKVIQLEELIQQAGELV